MTTADILDALNAVAKFCLDHPDLVALVFVILGIARVEGSKLLTAIKAKQWAAIDDILVEFMTEAAETIMSNPERKAWVLSQAMQVAQRLGMTKGLGLAVPEDLGARMETLWSTVVQPQLKAGELKPILTDAKSLVESLPTLPSPVPEDAPVQLDIEVKDGKATVGADIGPVSIKLPLDLRF